MLQDPLNNSGKHSVYVTNFEGTDEQPAVEQRRCRLQAQLAGSTVLPEVRKQVLKTQSCNGCSKHSQSS
jgi:hypothetical protein